MRTRTKVLAALLAGVSALALSQTGTSSRYNVGTGAAVLGTVVLQSTDGSNASPVDTVHPLPVTGTFTATPSGTQDVNLKQVGGATISQGHGTAATAVRVELPTDGTGVVGLAAGSAVIGHVIVDTAPSTAVTNAGTFAVQAAQSGTWTVQPGNTANTTPWLFTPQAGTSGGVSTYSEIVPNNTTGISVKGSAGMVYSAAMFNNSTVIAYVKLYDTAGTPTCGSGTPVWRGMIPGNTGGAGFIQEVAVGRTFTSGVGMCVTGGIADNDTTAPAASEYLVNIGYK